MSIPDHGEYDPPQVYSVIGVEHWLDNQTHHLRFNLANGKEVVVSLLTPCTIGRLADQCGMLEDRLRAMIASEPIVDEDG